MSDSFGAAFGRLVKSKRGSWHPRMSQTDLVQAIYPNLSYAEADKKKSDISKLENGKVANPQTATVQRIAEVLMISVEEIAELRRTAATPAQKLGQLPALSRAELEDLAARFEIDGRYDMPVDMLREQLALRADDYRTYRQQIETIDDAALRAHNLKSRAEEAAEQLDFDAVEEVLAEVDAIETVQSFQTKLARGQNALLRGRVERAYQIFSAAADSLGSLDTNAPAQARLQLEDLLYTHGLRYGSRGMAFAEQMLREALKTIDREQSGFLWSIAQNSLGIALRNQGTRTEGEEGAALLAQAVTAYDAALGVRTRADHPVEWAATQNNKGIALQEQGTRTEGEEGAALLMQAVAAYDAALVVYTRTDHPVDWAGTQTNKGAALRNQGSRTEGADGAALLARAVAAYDAALEVCTRADHPVEWAGTQKNLAMAKEACAAHDSADDPLGLLNAALTHVEAALTVFDPEHLSYEHAQCTALREHIRAQLNALG